MLLKTAIQIAKDNAPLGSGLGTFGSEASRINYSQLYYQYNISGYGDCQKLIHYLLQILIGQWYWVNMVLLELLLCF